MMHRVANILPPSTRSGELTPQRRTTRRVSSTDLIEMLTPRLAVGICLNVSEGGLRVAVDAALHPGEACRIRRHVATGPAIENYLVVWSREVSDGWIAGLARDDVH
ncbi:MAG: hypothetical protein FJ095_17300 [Deltaproteobacteria bacterium]|nr:hypothetical protein [Deltaproteobacteria bacterium]